ncbi:hypothetical protein LX36DRAFT_660835 [Colletotrichum falcatum]|nr:hypothetical protein LX36DRAFT_660835 [Colletotrichum falcatum]
MLPPPAPPPPAHTHGHAEAEGESASRGTEKASNAAVDPPCATFGRQEPAMRERPRRPAAVTHVSPASRSPTALKTSWGGGGLRRSLPCP